MIQVGNCYLAWAADPQIKQRASSGGFVTAALVAALRSKLVEAAVVIKKLRDVYEGIPLITSDPDEVIRSAGAMHAVPLNLARYLKPGRKLGVVVKPCDAMGIYERAKRGQLNLDEIFMIGLNCGGSFHPLSIREAATKLYKIDPDSLIREEIAKGRLILETAEAKHRYRISELEKQGLGRRSNCSYCGMLIPSMADLACGNWGADPGTTFVEVITQKGAQFFQNGLEQGLVQAKPASQEAIQARERIRSEMIQLAQAWKQRYLEPMEREARFQYYLTQLSRCLGCGACMVICPICNCLEGAKCLALQEPYHLMPYFILVRLFHVMDSCIGCGQCEDVCPMEIPLAQIHRRFNERVRQKWNYIPGMDLTIPPLFETELRWKE